MKQVFDDAFDATSDTPKESLNLKFRADLMDRIVEQVDAEVASGRAAKRLGVTQPRISDVHRGKLPLFSLDALVNMPAAMGKAAEFRVA